jgi:hypothetical protein
MRFYAAKAEEVVDLGRDGLVLKLMMHQRGGVTLIVVISRAQGEGQTHIALVYDTRSYQADPPEPLAWAYPGADITDRGTTTRDPFTTVFKHYAEKAGALRKGAPLENGSIASDDSAVDVIDGSRPAGQHRPVALKLIVRRWRGAVATAVISRGEQETETHIYVNFPRG